MGKLTKDIMTNKIKAVGFYLAGENIASIKNRLNKPYTTVKRWINQYEDTHNFQKRRGSGRKKSLNSKIQKTILNMLKKDCSLTYKEIAKKIGSSKSTVGRFLKTIGKKYKPSYGNVLSEKNRLLRLEYCEKILKMDFKNIIFSDESIFTINDNQNVRFFRKYGEEKMEFPKRNPPSKINIWGAISLAGPVGFKVIKGNLTGKKYIELIKEELIPNAKRMLGNFIFQQDNARPHVSREVMEFFRMKKIKVLEHPPQSPDLNPIELM